MSPPEQDIKQEEMGMDAEDWEVVNSGYYTGEEMLWPSQMIEREGFIRLARERSSDGSRLSHIDFARLILPDGLSDDDVSNILWEHTGFPAFWPSRDPFRSLVAQLIHARNRILAYRTELALSPSTGSGGTEK